MIFQEDSDVQIVKIRSLADKDIPALIEIASNWVKDRNTGEVVYSELDDIKRRMESSLSIKDYYYYVILVNKTPVGCCALRIPEEKMLKYKKSPKTKTYELVNVFMDPDYRGKGLGFKLLNYMFNKAKKLGYEEVIWNSGPRYKNTAWDFYTKLVGEPIAIAKSFYGKGGDAPIWRKEL